jgi:hypothetical protein
MKLSEAISLSAMLSPQAFGYFVDAGGGRCAFGAAKAAIGQSTDYSEWKWASRIVNCPACSGMCCPLFMSYPRRVPSHRDHSASNRGGDAESRRRTARMRRERWAHAGVRSGASS